MKPVTLIRLTEEEVFVHNDVHYLDHRIHDSSLSPVYGSYEVVEHYEDTEQLPIHHLTLYEAQEKGRDGKLVYEEYVAVEDALWKKLDNVVRKPLVSQIESLEGNIKVYSKNNKTIRERNLKLKGERDAYKGNLSKLQGSIWQRIKFVFTGE